MPLSKSDIQTVGDLMTGDLVALRPVDVVDRARQILTESGLHALPIIDGNETVGVVTLADCHRRSPTDALADVISRPPVTIGVGASVADAAALMRTEHIHHLLVTDKVGRTPEVVGILSSLDLLKMLTN